MHRQASFFIAAMLLAACAPQIVTLRPAPEAELAATVGTGAATAIVSGVRVTAMQRTWPGRTPIENVVTPLRVRVDNDSGKPILIRYDYIALISGAASAYAALPPYSIDVTFAMPRLASGYPVLNEPGFTGSGFAVSPVYAPAYPGIPIAAGSFNYDMHYYTLYGNYWRNVFLPTPEMLRLALPEGSLVSTGSADGFVYFEEVGPDVSRVHFRMKVVNADSGETMGTVNIPFIVTSQ